MRSTVPGRVSRIPTNELTSNSKNFVDLAEEPFVGFVQLTSQKNKIFMATKKKGNINSPFHKTLPKSSLLQMYLISVRFYEMGD